MFKAKQLVFYTCVSPVHMGAGSAVGAIDNPIQREVHTDYPLIAGSGLKGAVRHHFQHTWNGEHQSLIVRIFGPDKDASDHAGAIAFTDAQLVAFPVRSLRNTFVYATSPTALARLKRLAGEVAGWPAQFDFKDSEAKISSAKALANGRLVLEAFDFEGVEDAQVRKIADWLADNALPHGDEHAFFRQKLQEDLVVLPDTEFTHFVRHATVVEPHVRIKNDTGTADGGGLFYTENLPPETLLAGLVLATVERPSKKSDSRNGLKSAEQVLAAVLEDDGEREGLGGRLLQVGGDATTGRGLILVHPAKVTGA